MKKMFLSCILCVVSALLCAQIIYTAPKKPWTFIVYMAAANDLNAYVALDLQEMMKVGSTDDVNVIVYLTLQEDNKPKITRKLYINRGSMTQIGVDMVRDSGDVGTLQEALQWACIDYPSDHIAAVLWDHGSGPLNRSKMELLCRGVCYDYDTGHYLTDRDCLEAFSWARDTFRGGQKFDIIAFDACFLASLELAYTLSSCADYMVASEETIPSDGYQYAYLLSPFATQSLDSLSFARHMVNTYRREYSRMTNYTLSAIDLNAVQNLVTNCNAIAQFLTVQLKGKNRSAVRSIIKKCMLNCSSFDEGIYIDLYQFYKNLLKSITGLKLTNTGTVQLKQMLNDGVASFSTIIKARVMNVPYSQVGGLSIYFARYALDPSYYGLYWTQNNPHWLDLLEAYSL